MPLIDPFVMQLIIVPLTVIGVGLAIAIYTKKVWLAPAVTLVLNLIYEIWYSFSFDPNIGISFSSWNITFPLVALVFSWLVVFLIKEEQADKKGNESTNK